jgi:hypothetical protein
MPQLLNVIQNLCLPGPRRLYCYTHRFCTLNKSNNRASKTALVCLGEWGVPFDHTEMHKNASNISFIANLLGPKRRSCYMSTTKARIVCLILLWNKTWSNFWLASSEEQEGYPMREG